METTDKGSGKEQQQPHPRLAQKDPGFRTLATGHTVRDQDAKSDLHEEVLGMVSPWPPCLCVVPQRLRCLS